MNEFFNGGGWAVTCVAAVFIALCAAMWDYNVRAETLAQQSRAECVRAGANWVTIGGNYQCLFLRDGAPLAKQ